MRRTNDDILIDVAKLFAERSTCPRLNVGCVIAKNGRIVATGYNGAPPGQPHCTDIGCLIDGGCQRAIHAEANALAFSARNGSNTEGASAYLTHNPCFGCAKLMVSAGIERVMYDEEYITERTKPAIDLLIASDVLVVKYGG